MCSIDNSDLLQELWYKYLNSHFKNKSDNLLIFLRSLYLKSIKQRNRPGTVFITSDISGIAIILTKQFLNDLENLYMLKDESHESTSQSRNLRSYLESENGSLMLYGIEFIIEQIMIAKQNKTDTLKSSVLKIILESELGNILATALLSILTEMCLNPAQLAGKDVSDTITVPEITFSHYLRQELSPTNPSKKTQKTAKPRLRKTEEYSTDDDNIFVPHLHSARLRRKHLQKSKLYNRSGLSTRYLYQSELGKYRSEDFGICEFQPQSQTEFGELFQSDIEDSTLDDGTRPDDETDRSVNVITSLRIVARLLHHIIPLDPSVYTDAISIYLEILKSCCLLINNGDCTTSPFHLQLLKLADSLVSNIALTVKILILEQSENNSSMTVLLGHKVVDRLLQICQSFRETHESLPLWGDINRLVFYIFIIVSKHVISHYTGSCRGIIHLITCWYYTDGSRITQQALNQEIDNEDFVILLRNSKMSLFSQICLLLSILREIPDEKRKTSHNHRNNDIFAHHTSQFNYIPMANKPEVANDICCYASICQLILNNLVHLLINDSESKSLSTKKKQFYHHILSSIKAISFCCTIDLLAYSNKLVALLMNPMPEAVKFIVIRFLQRIIEISFEFYKYRFNCDCQYTSRHDVICILHEIRDVCIPTFKGSLCARQYCDVTFTDLLHFIDWLAKIHDDLMKHLVIDNVTKPILNRLIAHTSADSVPHYEMIGSSIFSLLPYLNSPWEIDDLQLSWAVCQKYPRLKRNYYKCLTIILLSTRPASNIDFNEKPKKTRIIDYLISTVNFENLMKRLDHSPLFLTESIGILLDDVYIWHCFRILFTYNDEFRRGIFDNNGIDCCYVMLKQIIEFIRQLKAVDSEVLKESVFLLFESLMCLVIDGNMLKNVYYYEGYSYELIWNQLQLAILKFFPTDEIIAQQLIQSLLNCCFRHKWTIQNDLYQLRKLFLDSIISINQSINNPNVDTYFSDFDVESNPSDNDNDQDCLHDNKYDADVSSDLMNDDETEFKMARQHDLQEIEGERANVFIDLNTSDANGNNMEINTDFLRLFIKILLSLPIDNYHAIGQKALESVYNSFRFVPDKSQRTFICDDFMERMISSIEKILTSHSIPGLQLILLKLLILPDSCWCTASRLRFLIDLSEKNPSLREDILKMLLEKADLINSFQPELSLSLPIVEEKIQKATRLNSSLFDSFSIDKDEEETFDYLIDAKLTRSNWKGLDFDADYENSGFCVSMWIQMDGTVKCRRRKKHVEPKKNKKKHSKSATPVKNPLAKDIWSLGKSSLNNQELVHVTSLYSKEKSTDSKYLCFQIWCNPTSGTVVVRLYQRIIGSSNNSEYASREILHPSKSKPQIRSHLMNLFSPLSNSKVEINEPVSAMEFNSRSSFVLVGETVMKNFVPLSTWNFLTISVSWRHSEYGLVIWQLNGNLSHQTKLYHKPPYKSGAGSNLESYIAIGQINNNSGLLNQNYNLGSMFVFETPIIQCSNDNLSLMFMSQNWDGHPIIFNKSQRDASKILGSVVMRILVDKQANTELAALMFERSQHILDYKWVDKMNDLISNHMVGSFCCGTVTTFEVNGNYTGDTELASTILTDNPQSSSIYPPFESERITPSSSLCLKKYFLVKTSIDSAFENLGGTSILFFWLAKLVEQNDHICFRWLLKLVLLLFRKSTFLSYQNIKENGYSILFQLFKTFKMPLNFDIISDLVQHMIYECPMKLKLTQPSKSRLCRDPNLLQELLIQWKIWATSKLFACDGEIAMTECHALVLDKYILNQINSLVNEDNIYSIINCGALGVIGILSPLLIACQEPFEALKRPLPIEIFHILLEIITNLIPTPADLAIVTKLCNTILQLYPVSMRDNDTELGRYYRHLKTFANEESEILHTDLENPVQSNERIEILDETVIEEDYFELKRNLPSIKVLSASLRESRVSEVEKKAMKQFYDATMSDIPDAVDEDNGTREIETSTGSSTSEINMGPIINDENDNSLMTTSLETLFMTSSTELTEKPVINCYCESSRVQIITGLISTLENVIEVKISDSVLEKFSIQNFCFEFILHLLTHSCSIVRQKSLSLLRVYLYQKRTLIQQLNSQPSMLNVAAHVIHQFPSTKEIIAESMSIIFGQNLSHLIMDIQWDRYQNSDEVGLVIITFTSAIPYDKWNEGCTLSLNIVIEEAHHSMDQVTHGYMATSYFIIPYLCRRH